MRRHVFLLDYVANALAFLMGARGQYQVFYKVEELSTYERAQCDIFDCFHINLFCPRSVDTVNIFCHLHQLEWIPVIYLGKIDILLFALWFLLWFFPFNRSRWTRIKLFPCHLVFFRRQQWRWLWGNHLGSKRQPEGKGLVHQDIKLYIVTALNCSM